MLGIVPGFFHPGAVAERRWLRDSAGVYIWFFRSLPLLVLLIRLQPRCRCFRPPAWCCPTSTPRA